MTIIPSASLRGPWAKAPHSHPDCLTTSQHHSTLRLDNHSSTSSMAYYSYLHHLGLETPHSTFFFFFCLPARRYNMHQRALTILSFSGVRDLGDLDWILICLGDQATRGKHYPIFYSFFSCITTFSTTISFTCIIQLVTGVHCIWGMGWIRDTLDNSHVRYTQIKPNEIKHFKSNKFKPPIVILPMRNQTWRAQPRSYSDLIVSTKPRSRSFVSFVSARG